MRSAPAAGGPGRSPGRLGTRPRSLRLTLYKGNES
jgi:hypothetical protein